MPLLQVRAWEQKLSLIGECIEVWMHVQRKWMYLESIFVGSDDIRHQLPAEAKRFDNIDRQWQKVMNDTAKVCCRRALVCSGAGQSRIWKAACRLAVSSRHMCF